MAPLCRLRGICGHVAGHAPAGSSVAASVKPAQSRPGPAQRLDWRTMGLLAAGLDLSQVRDQLVEDAASKVGRAGHFPDEPFETRLLRLFEDRLQDAPEIFRENTHLPGFFCLFFHPAILDLVSMILDDPQELRLYPNYGCRPKLPGKHRDEVLWHSDAGYTYYGPSANQDRADMRDPNELTVEKVERMAQSMINVWTPLVPVNPSNGCMMFSRGSHKLGLVQHEYRRDLGADTREGHWLHIDEAVRESHCSPECGRLVDVVMDPGE
jgi:hypothetical protein